MLSRTWIIKTQIHAVTVRGVCLPATWLGLSQRWNISRLFYGFCRTVEPQEHSPVLPASSTPPPASSSSLEFLGSFLLPLHLLCHLLSLLLFPKNCSKENQALHLVLGREPKNKQKKFIFIWCHRDTDRLFFSSLCGCCLMEIWLRLETGWILNDDSADSESEWGRLRSWRNSQGVLWRELLQSLLPKNLKHSSQRPNKYKEYTITPREQWKWLWSGGRTVFVQNQLMMKS